MRKLRRRKNERETVTAMARGSCICGCGCNGICKCQVAPTHDIQNGQISQGITSTSRSASGSAASY